MLRATTAIAVLILGVGSASAQGDVPAGEVVFKKCAICHMVGEGAKTKAGPVLNGVLGRTAGTLEGYSYSKPMKDAGTGGLVWTPETLAEFLTKPKDFVKGTKMTFTGLSKPEDVTNVIAYLATYSPDFQPPPPQ